MPQQRRPDQPYAYRKKDESHHSVKVWAWLAWFCHFFRNPHVARITIVMKIPWFVFVFQ